MRISFSVIGALCLCASAFGSEPIILINPSNPQVAIGATVQLSADRAVETGNGTIIDFGIDKAVTWSSSSTAIATVNSSGLVTAIASGVASITASINQAPFHASTQVTVVAQSNFFVYVPNEVSTDISGYTAAAGTLTSIAGSPFATGGLNPVNVAADPAGKFAYVTDIANDNLYGYQINPSSGVLSPIAGFPFPVDISPAPNWWIRAVIICMWVILLRITSPSIKLVRAVRSLDSRITLSCWTLCVRHGDRSHWQVSLCRQLSGRLAIGL